MSKFFGGGLLLLSNISLISVGFSAWSIGTVGSAEIPITVAVEDVIDINRYIHYSNEADIFEFCRDGIMSDGMIVPNGDAIVNFEVVLDDASDKMRNHLSDGASSISIKTSFITGNISFLAPYLDSVSLSVSDIGFSDSFAFTSSDNQNDGRTFDSNFHSSIGLDSSHLYFRTKFSFKFPTGDDFYSNVYTKMNGNRFFFSFKAVLS